MEGELHEASLRKGVHEIPFSKLQSASNNVGAARPTAGPPNAQLNENMSESRTYLNAPVVAHSHHGQYFYREKPGASDDNYGVRVSSV